MNPKSNNKSTTLILTNLTIAIALLIVHVRLSPYAFDDAYIHFRVAQNLLDTGQPYFNEGEPVKVSSSSGWVVFLAGLLAITRWVGIESNFALVVSVFNAAILFLGAWVYVIMLQALLKRRLTFSETLLFQIQYLALLLLSSWGLMETGLALLLTGLGLLLLVQSKPWGISILSFVVFIRLELIIPLGLIILLLIFRKTNPIKLLGFAVIGILPLAILDLYYFYTLVPQPVVAKPLVYSVAYYQAMLDLWLNSLPHNSANLLWNFFVFGTLTWTYFHIVLAIGFQERKTRVGAWALVFGLCALLISGAYVLGRALLFDWYRPLYMIPLILAGHILVFSKGRAITMLRSTVYLTAAISTIPIMTTLYASLVNPGVLSSHFELGSRVRVYQQVGAFLYEYFPESDLMTSEIGGLSYTFKGEILDAVGLASPQALMFHPLKVPEERSNASIGAIPPAFVWSNMPDLIVSFDIFAEALLKDDVVSHYHQILVPAFLPEDEARSEIKAVWGSNYLRIYIRKGLQVPPEFSNPETCCDEFEWENDDNPW